MKLIKSSARLTLLIQQVRVAEYCGKPEIAVMRLRFFFFFFFFFFSPNQLVSAGFQLTYLQYFALY